MTSYVLDLQLAKILLHLKSIEYISVEFTFLDSPAFE